jgi:hypothetical protein
MRGTVRQAEEAKHRAEEVRRRIKEGAVEPRPLPSLREDSMPSAPTMPSIESMKSAELMDKTRSSTDYSKEY